MVYDEKKAAPFLGVKSGTLRNWRYQKKGPAYIKCGKAVRYTESDLIKYIERQRVEH